MSFYVYYGKLEDELIVAVLPNGTIEHDDPIYIYSKKRFSSYKAADVTVTEDGEDAFLFKDGYFTYNAVSKKSHRELDLTVKGGSRNPIKVTLVRQYDQALLATPPLNSPKIWTGALKFHEWARDEPIIVIAPQGLRKGSPIVSLWQWTKDANGVAKTLSFSTAKQESDAKDPTTFSFSQNGYYTLNCKINAKTNGLNIIMKSPSNPEAAQDEMILSAEVKSGAEHKLAPPRAPQQQITLDCSLPRVTPSLPRVTSALPFPADLVETLKHSAAYLDHAGYMANYAVRQFNQLDKSYHQLETKSEARATRIFKLEVEVTSLKESGAVSKRLAEELQKQLDQSRALAAAQQKKYEAEIKEVQAALAASKSREVEYKKYIAADKLADIEREKEHHAHEEADHSRISSLQRELASANTKIRELHNNLDEKHKAIVALEASKDVLSKELTTAKREIETLRATIKTHETSIAALNKSIADVTHAHDLDHAELEKAKVKISEQGVTIAEQKATITKGVNALGAERELKKLTENAKDNLQKQLDEAIEDLAKLEAKYDALEKKTPAVKDDAFKSHGPVQVLKTKGIDGHGHVTITTVPVA